MNMINIADLKDPGDTEGRTYREVNNSEEHKLKVGQLVEMESGARLFIAKLTRDCDGTPLYSLTPCNERQFINQELEQMKWIHGYSEECLKAI